MTRVVAAFSVLPISMLLASAPAAAQQVESDASAGTESTPSKSKEKMSFEELARNGIEHYQNEAYEKAIEYFDRAYQKKNEPDMLYNIGRCHEHLDQYEKAIEAYKKYAKNPEVETADRKEALSRIETIEKLAGMEGGTDTGGGSDGQPLRTAGWILSGVGGAALVGGGVMAGLSASARSDMMDSSRLSRARAARNRAQGQALFADILFGTGIAAGGVGAAFLLTTMGGSKEQSANAAEGGEAAVRFEPIVTSGGIGLTIGGDF